MKKIWLTILGNVVIASIAIVLYSPGLLALRPSDESILRAGSSIFCVILLAFAFVLVNKNIITKTTTNNGTQVTRKDADVLNQLSKYYEKMHVYDAKNTTKQILQYLAQIYILLNNSTDTVKATEVRKKIDFYIQSVEELLVVLLKLEAGWTLSNAHAENWKANMDALNTIKTVFQNILDDLSDDTNPDFSTDIIRERAKLDGYTPDETDDILNKYN